MLCVTTKVYEAIPGKRIRATIKLQLRDEQSGFRKQQGAEDHTFTLQQITEKIVTKNKKICYCRKKLLLT